MKTRPTALVADDEPLLREALVRHLQLAWPELLVVGQARNGREAIQLFDDHLPDVCFLDIRMPGLSGMDAANHIGRRAHVVFVTAHDQYAIEAFTHGALDYVLKPVEPERLAETIARLKARLALSEPAMNTEALLQQLTTELRQRGVLPNLARSTPLRWIRTQAGQTVRLVAVDDIDYLRSEAKYTTVAWHAEDGSTYDGVVRIPLKDLLPQLDANHFVQVHRAVVVNLRSVDRVQRHDNETAEVRLKRRPERLPVSRSYLSVFKQM